MDDPTALISDAVADRSTDDVRTRILAATTELITAGGREAVTTRAVAAAAGVQPPALYRLFGNMRGLLDAVARESLARYVRQKATRTLAADPVEDLRRGWELHVALGLAHPALYTLIYGDPTGGALPTAAREGEVHLHALVSRVAAAGRLKVGIAHAARLIAAAGNGVTLALIGTRPEERDLRLSDAMCEAVLSAVMTTSSPDGDVGGAPDDAPHSGGSPGMVSARAIALRAVLADAPDGARSALSPAEQDLLNEWLDRLTEANA